MVWALSTNGKPETSKTNMAKNTHEKRVRRSRKESDDVVIECLEERELDWIGEGHWQETERSGQNL